MQRVSRFAGGPFLFGEAGMGMAGQGVGRVRVPVLTVIAKRSKRSAVALVRALLMGSGTGPCPRLAMGFGQQE